MSNIWHDINPRRISPEKFMAVNENPKRGKKKKEKERYKNGSNPALPQKKLPLR